MLLRSITTLAPMSSRRRGSSFWGAAIAIISMTIGATAAELTSDQPAADWMQGYGERNKDCLEWTDTCVNCVRAQWREL